MDLPGKGCFSNHERDNPIRKQGICSLCPSWYMPFALQRRAAFLANCRFSWTAVDRIGGFCFLVRGGTQDFCTIFLYQDGILRLYTAAAMALGMLLYHKIASRWVVKGISEALCRIVSLFVWTYKKLDIFRQKTVAKFVRKAYTGNSNREGNV